MSNFPLINYFSFSANSWNFDKTFSLFLVQFFAEIISRSEVGDHSTELFIQQSQVQGIRVTGLWIFLSFCMSVIHQLDVSGARPGFWVCCLIIMLVISMSWMLLVYRVFIFGTFSGHPLVGCFQYAASSFGMLLIHELEVSRMQPLILGCQDII